MYFKATRAATRGEVCVEDLQDMYLAYVCMSTSLVRLLCFQVETTRVEFVEDLKNAYGLQQNAGFVVLCMYVCTYVRMYVCTHTHMYRLLTLRMHRLLMLVCICADIRAKSNKKTKDFISCVYISTCIHSKHIASKNFTWTLFRHAYDYNNTHTYNMP